MRYLTLLFIIIFGSVLHAQTEYEKIVRHLAEPGKEDSMRLEALYTLQYHYYMREYPEWALYAGYDRAYDAWTDDSFKAVERRKQEFRTFTEAIKSINPNNLSERQRLNYDLLVYSNNDHLEAQKFPYEYMPISQ